MDPTTRLEYEKSLRDAMTAMGMFIHAVRTRKMASETLTEDARRAYAKLSALIKARDEFSPAADVSE